MKIKSLSAILTLLLFSVFLFADTAEKESSSAVIKFVLAPMNDVGYSTRPISSITDQVEEFANGEIFLEESADGGELVNASTLYAYWKINLSRSTNLKLTLRIQEDMVSETGSTLPMTVNIDGNSAITGKDSEFTFFEGVADNPIYGSKLLKISCPVDKETRSGEYKGKLLLTLLEV